MALDGPRQTQSFRGWDFSFDPQAPAGPTLTRHLPDGTLKTVYVVEAGLHAYEDFAPMVRAHYSEPGFGPFLASLRAVRIHADAVLTLRDAVYGRDTRIGRTTRRVGGREGLQGLLTTQFGLPADLVGRALHALHRHRPDLLVEPRWFALGRGRISESMAVAPPGRDEVPDVLVSLATVGREASVQRLLASLAQEVSASRYPPRRGVDRREPRVGSAG
ncbi:MAG: hypothetical protein R3F60_22060 [bacterium]